MGLRFDVVGDETRPPLGRDVTGHTDRPRMIRIVGVEQREDGARIPENAAGHRLRMACLLRAPGVRPPPRPAPTSRNIGWSGENGGMPRAGVPAPTGLNGARGNEAPPTSAHAREVAPLNQPPDGRT